MAEGAEGEGKTDKAGATSLDARQKPASSGAALLRLARKQRSPTLASPPVSIRQGILLPYTCIRRSGQDVDSSDCIGILQVLQGCEQAASCMRDTHCLGECCQPYTSLPCRASETGAATARAAAGHISAIHPHDGPENAPTDQRGHDVSTQNGAGQSLRHNGQGGLPEPQARAGVDVAVQATPVKHRVPVQAVRLSPASPDQQASCPSCF